jgi:hypothetical protein
MSAPPIIAFTPVPLRNRSDGWTPELQLRFIAALSRGLTAGEAARSVGKNRQNAYALRKRAGAESFAAAWDCVIAYARRVRSQDRSPRPVPDPKLARGAEGEAIAKSAAAAIRDASSPAAANRAFEEMLDALYGPKSDKRGGGSRSDGGTSAPVESRNL